MVAGGSSGDGVPLQRFERQLLENYPFLAVLMTVLVAAPYAKTYEGDLGNWDWLFISGIWVFLVAHPLSLLLPDRVGEALRELQGRGILRPEEVISSFEYRLNILANRWARVGGIVLAGVMCLVWLVAYGGTLPVRRDTIELTIPGMLVEMALSIAAGRFIGRGLCYGTLAGRLHVEGITFRPIPSHRDGVAGLGPVGNIYFVHAILIVPIVAFLSVWVVLFPLLGPGYALWRLLYIVLLIFMVTLEVVTVFRPLYAFNRILLEWKQEILGDPSVSGARVHEYGIITSGQQQLFMRKQHDWIERMPTWILSRVKCCFLIGVNILVVIPPLLAVAGFIRV
jgi:hypothetical protein